MKKDKMVRNISKLSSTIVKLEFLHLWQLLRRVDGKGGPENLDEYSNQVAAWRRVHHPRICKMLGMTRRGDALIAMSEFPPKGDLLSYVAYTGRFSKHDAKCIFTRVASAVQHLHALNIAHGSLRLDSILIDIDGELKIDFAFPFLLRDLNRT